MLLSVRSWFIKNYLFWYEVYDQNYGITPEYKETGLNLNYYFSQEILVQAVTGKRRIVDILQEYNITVYADNESLADLW